MINIRLLLLCSNWQKNMEYCLLFSCAQIIMNMVPVILECTTIFFGFQVVRVVNVLFVYMCTANLICKELFW